MSASQPRVAAAVFDLDGTLVDSEPLYAECDEAFLAEYGIRIEANEYLGVGTRAFFLDLERRFPDSPLSAIDLEERIRLKDADYIEMAAGRVRAFPASAALAAALSRRGLPLAIASASDPGIVEAILARTGLRGLFDVVLSSYDVPRGKPEPDVFLEAARRLGAQASECVVFEDSRIGVIAARRARMRCVALPAPCREPGTLHPDFGLADIVVEGGPAALDPAGLLAALEGWGLPSEPPNEARLPP